MSLSAKADNPVITDVSDQSRSAQRTGCPGSPADAGQQCPLSDHLADNRRHIRCRERSQRFGADVAERAETQAKRHGGRLIGRFDDCHDVIPSLRPEDVLHGHSKRLRHLPEGICPLRGFLSVADSLIGELRKHDISYHGHPPWLGPCATWHEEVVRRLPQHAALIYIMVVPDTHGQRALPRPTHSSPPLSAAPCSATKS